jgi:signal transduction histidine kinase
MDVPFTISARTAKLIGMENFANAEGAIVELVKNAYDADAEICVVAADIRETKEGSRIFIIDNGTGMTEETILRHWMTIGTDDKLLNARTSGKLRVKSGAKGIGRFALNRLGMKAEMITFTKDAESQGHKWFVDWSMFDKAEILSEITASVSDCNHEEARATFEEYGLNKLPIAKELDFDHFQGTALCISNLKDNWTTEELNSLLMNLEMLVPEHMKSLFSLYLYNLQDLSWSGEVTPTEYSDYDYKVAAKFDGVRTIHVFLERNELNVSLLETKYASVFKRKSMQISPYRLEDFHAKTIEKSIEINEAVSSELLSNVGSFSFTFYFIKNTISDDRDRDGAKKYPYNQIDSAARKRWLEKFGGVRIFRDDFRVRPYGENGNDWLDLGRRQAQSPGGAGQKLGGYRIRPNQISGVVNISRLTNKAFEDKSSREGIQENDEFQVFKNLLIQIISVFEEDRNYVMYNLADQYRIEHPVTIKARDIAKEAMSEKGDGQSEEALKLRTLAESYHSLEEELDAKEAELAMIRGLASMGISVATYTHELRSVMLRLIPRNDLLRTILTKYLPLEQFDGMRFNNPYKELDTMKGEDEKLYNWLLYSLHSIQRSKRDWKEIKLSEYFKDFAKAWEPSLSKKNIKIIPSIIGMEDARIDAFEMDLDSVYNNFVANSINAFLKSSELNKVIKLNAINDHGYAVVDFLDNGCGLASEYKDNPEVIFNAFETSIVDNKNNKIGTGMGLFIAKGVMDKFDDSTIAVLPVEKGFGIRTIFKLKKK